MATSSEWPQPLDRTLDKEREPYKEGGGFRVKRSRAVNSIEKQLDKLKASDIEVQVLDPEVIVYYDYEGQYRVVGSDSYDNVRDNARAISKYISAKRAIDRYNVKTPDAEWSNTTLPDVYHGETERHQESLVDEVIGAFGSVLGTQESDPIDDFEPEDSSFGDTEAQMILGLGSDPTEDEIKDTVRDLVKDLHPDKQNGDEDQFKAVMKAKSQLLD